MSIPRVIPQNRVLSHQPRGQCPKCAQRCESILVAGDSPEARTWMLADRLDAFRGVFILHQCTQDRRRAA